jgi:hypothetical protein
MKTVIPFLARGGDGVLRCHLTITVTGYAAPNDPGDDALMIEYKVHGPLGVHGDDYFARQDIRSFVEELRSYVNDGSGQPSLSSEDGSVSIRTFPSEHGLDAEIVAVDVGGAKGTSRFPLRPGTALSAVQAYDRCGVDRAFPTRAA